MLDHLLYPQAGSAGAGMPGGSTVRPFVEARLELAAHNSSILYLKLASLAIAVRPPDLMLHQRCWPERSCGWSRCRACSAMNKNMRCA